MAIRLAVAIQVSVCIDTMSPVAVAIRGPIAKAGTRQIWKI